MAELAMVHDTGGTTSDYAKLRRRSRGNGYVFHLTQGVAHLR